MGTQVSGSKFSPKDKSPQYSISLAMAAHIVRIVVDHKDDLTAAASILNAGAFGCNNNRVLSVLQAMKTVGIVDYELVNGTIAKIWLPSDVPADAILAITGLSSAFDGETDAVEEEPPAVVIIRLMGISFTVEEVHALYRALTARVRFILDHMDASSFILEKVGIKDDLDGMEELLALIKSTGLVNDEPVVAPTRLPISTSFSAGTAADNGRAPIYVNAEGFVDLANFDFTDYARLMKDITPSHSQVVLRKLFNSATPLPYDQFPLVGVGTPRLKLYGNMLEVMESHGVIRRWMEDGITVYMLSSDFKEFWEKFQNAK